VTDKGTIRPAVEDESSALSLYHLLDPNVLANPYPLFARLREEDPVHWDPFLHAWVVTRYEDVLEVLHTFSADRTPTPARLESMGLSELSPIAALMVRQMLFMDAPSHTRLRSLAAKAFTPARVETLKAHIQEIVDGLLDEVQHQGCLDIIADLGEPLPAIVTAEMLGVPVSDRRLLKNWSANFAEMLGNFQHNPERAKQMLQTVEDMTSYFRDAIQDIKRHPREGLIHSLLTAEIDGDRLSDEEVVANTIVTMVGGQETTTNLIGNGMLSLLRNPDQLEKLRNDLSLIPAAVEEMLRYESPSQHTARLAPEGRELGGKQIRKRDAVIAVMAAANRDPERFPDPDRFDIARSDNRHLAFGYAAHFCFGAPLARVEGQIAFATLLRRMPALRLEPQQLVWRSNLGLRGLVSLKVRFDEPSGSVDTKRKQQVNREQASGSCLHKLIEAQAARTPDAVAVSQGSNKLSYKQLDLRANQLASYLRSKGVGPDTPVGVCLHRSTELIIAFLAVLKAGGACLPLDPEYPKDRLIYMLGDSQAPVVITSSSLLDRLGEKQIQVVLVDVDEDRIATESSAAPVRNIAPNNLAYVIYTSGSTGKPRGVLLPHSALVSYVGAAIDLYGMTSGDRVAQFSSISFDIAVEEIYPTLASGATVVLRTGQGAPGASEFLEWLGKEQITVVDLPTAYWHELVRELAETRRSMPASVRLLIVGGEKASAATYKSWLDCVGKKVRWINTYGPTEATVIATAFEPDPNQPVPDNIPIGRAIANAEVYVLDEQLHPVNAGQAGELHIGGKGLAHGYLNRPEITAAKFIESPFKRGERLYKTGDMVRYLPDGNIEFIGRTDFQVKIRGFRVELGEIESALQKCDGVRECIVIAREDDGDKRLVAYLVASREQKPAVASVRSSLKQQLPEYMVPADYVYMDRLPLTPNGKVDRRALPAPELSGSAEQVAGPRTEAERKLSMIWEQILGKRPVGIHDNFFELGGHSLLALRMMRRIEQQFARRLPLTVLVQAPTIADLANLLEQETSSGLWSSVIPMQPDGNHPALFFVHGLGGTVMRFHELARHMAPDQPFYGLQASGLDGKQPPLKTVEEMAALYYEQIRGVQPEGPYFLGGYSFGGLVALEIARKLRSEGKQVAMLALVDTYAGVPPATSLVSKFFRLSWTQKLAYLRKRADRYRKGIKRRIDLLYMPAALRQVREACAIAERTYEPRPYAGKVTLFRASEKGLRGLDDSQLSGWHRYAKGGLEIHEIDADHGNILNEPRVRHLADAIKKCVRRARFEADVEISVPYETNISPSSVNSPHSYSVTPNENAY